MTPKVRAQVIDLKLLEAVGDSAGAEELRASLAEQERVHARELGEWKRAIDRATDVLAGEHLRSFLTRKASKLYQCVSPLAFKRDKC